MMIATYNYIGIYEGFGFHVVWGWRAGMEAEDGSLL